ncbi:MAG: hypothetical protein Q3M30_12270 [Candidatus Electrothrix sp. Rat3]|nr:hypothetical protein [Candidatus Electrothrix rattekaaiensis]
MQLHPLLQPPAGTVPAEKTLRIQAAILTAMSRCFWHNVALVAE